MAHNTMPWRIFKRKVTNFGEVYTNFAEVYRNFGEVYNDFA
jgi:hypothetical protein